MALLILGLVLFLGVHAFTMARGARARLIARIGEGPYKGLYAVGVLIGLVLIVLGWRAAPFVPLYEPPLALRHLTLLLVWIAFVLIVAAYVPSHIRARLRHPFLAGVKLWAFGHLLANGDLASLLLFGSVLAYAVIDRIAVKRRERAEGRATLPAPRAWGDAAAVLGGTALYLLFAFSLHPLLIGVPVMPV